MSKTFELTEKQKTCNHENFSAQVRVGRIHADGKPNEVIGFVADIKVACVDCQLPFSWIGVPYGSSPNEPMVSVDGLELRAPIAPGWNPVFGAPTRKKSDQVIPAFQIKRRGQGGRQ